MTAAMHAGGLATLLDLLAPSRCAVCKEPRTGVGGGGVCARCWGALPEIDPSASCPRCALPGSSAPCADCRRESPPVSRAHAHGRYEGPLARLVVAYKFRGFDLLARPAAERLARLAETTGLAREMDAVVPVPSTRRRNRDRGYDPGRLLAEETARRLGAPLAPLLRRVRDSVPQSALSAARRPANVAGAFAASPRANGRSLLLVDDVVTTGATAFACARALLAAGARRVDLLALARTPEPDDFRYPTHPEHS